MVAEPRLPENSNLLKMDGGRKWQQFNGSAGGRVEEMRRSRDWREQELRQEPPPPNQHPQNLSRRTAAEPPAETSTRSCARETKTVEESWGTSWLHPPKPPYPPPPSSRHPPTQLAQKCTCTSRPLNYPCGSTRGAVKKEKKTNLRVFDWDETCCMYFCRVYC